jgi:hypothetical protein
MTDAIRDVSYDRAAGATALSGWRAHVLREPFLEAAATAAADPAPPTAESAPEPE